MLTAKPTIEVTSNRAVNSQSPLLWILGQWWAAFAASSVFVVAGHLLIKAGLISLVPPAANSGFISRVLNAALHPPVIIGLLIYMMGTVCWMRAVSMKEISFLYPISSINYVLVAMASVLLFQEVLSPKRLGGVALIVLGMILMNRRSQSR